MSQIDKTDSPDCWGGAHVGLNFVFSSEIHAKIKQIFFQKGKGLKNLTFVVFKF